MSLSITYTYINMGVLACIFFVYFYCLFELGDSFLYNSKLNRNLRVLVSIFNVFSLFLFSIIPNITTLHNYIFLSVLIFVEFYLVYKDKLVRILVLVTAFILNILTVRSICVSIIAIIHKMSIYDTLLEEKWALLSIVITFLVLDILLFLVKIILPPEKAHIITEHNVQSVFLVSWSTICNIYLLFTNIKIYTTDLPYTFTVKNQLELSIVLLLGFYLILFFSIKIGESVMIKEKNLELSKTIENQKQFKEAIMSEAIIVYEVNLSKDTILKSIGSLPVAIEKNSNNYHDIFKQISEKCIYSEDIEEFSQHFSMENILNEYHKGNRELGLVCRVLTQDNSFIWVKGTVNTYENNTTGDIEGFIYIKDIHQEKTIELELKNRAEKDSLTKLYNKGYTENLISNFLADKDNQPCEGALFIIDVDNFKLINDFFGHTFGDSVLRELANKLRLVLRSSPDQESSNHYGDIIGRIGGDEFMIFIKNTSKIDLLISKAESICKEFHKTYSTINGEFSISSSIGIAVVPNNGTTFDELYRAADISLYISKNKGKDTYSFYNGEQFPGYESNRGEIESK